METISGSIERIVSHNPENGFAVLRVRLGGGREPHTVVGRHPALAVGEDVVCSGDWRIDPSYGRQFKADAIRTKTPATLGGIKKYLASGAIRGIGPKFADKLVAHFGEKVIEAIESGPEALMTVPGVGPAKAASLVGGWAEQRAVKEIMIFLHSNGVPTAMAAKIYRTYGNRAVELMHENPYRLARDVRGIGFKSADAIAMNMGVPKDSMTRARAGITHALEQASAQGHCGLPERLLAQAAAKLLGVDESLTQRAMETEVAEGGVIKDLIGGDPHIFTKALHRTETSLAERIKALAAGRPPWGDIDAERAIEWVQGDLNMQLGEEQKSALRLALKSKFMVITGGPGVGKTSMLVAFLRIIAGKRVAVSLCAPSGKAADRMSESCGDEAKTIHRTLEAGGTGFARNADNPLMSDVVVADECSMLDTWLANAMLQAIPDRAAVILVGDVDQLPSVGPGQVLYEIIKSGAVPVARLTQIFRQAAQSKIITNAHRINRGLMPESGAKGDDFFLIERDEPADIVNTILHLVADRIPKMGYDPVRDIQVLSPMKLAEMGTGNLNHLLQERLNPNAASIQKYGVTYRVGDKVIQTTNNYDRGVFNGNIGYVEAIDQDEGSVSVRFASGLAQYLLADLDELQLAYAITVHKYQGSESPVVVVPMSTQHYMMLKRNILYTGTTRGRKLVVAVGSKKALQLAVERSDTGGRYTRLGDLLARS